MEAADIIMANMLQASGKASGQRQAKFHARQLPTRANAVQQEIERQIVTGELATGAKLNEAAIADSLGVSRGPVREAIRSLAETGLVDLAANKGAVVRSMEPAEAMGLYDLRGVVFALACEQVAMAGEASMVAELDRCHAAMAEAAEAGDSVVYYDLNIAFHDAIMSACDNSQARSIYAALIKQLHLCRRRGLAMSENKQASLSEHAAIIEAIRAGDPKGAFDAGRGHVANGRERFARTLHSEANEARAGDLPTLMAQNSQP